MLTECDSQTIIIYGAGYLAHKLYDALRSRDQDKRVVRVVTSSGSEKPFEGMPVERFDPQNIQNNAVIYVAMNEVFKSEIESRLIQHGMNYVWIGAGEILEIIAGKPVHYGKSIKIRDILQSNHNYALAIRWLVIDQYYGANHIGEAIYAKFWRRVADEATAHKRLDSFKIMIANKNDVMAQQNAIKISTSNICLDGNHRLALLSFFGEESVKCDVYNSEYTEKYIEIFEAAYLSKEEIIGSKIYNEMEKKAILDMYERILGQYNA